MHGWTQVGSDALEAASESPTITAESWDQAAGGAFKEALNLVLWQRLPGRLTLTQAEAIAVACYERVIEELRTPRDESQPWDKPSSGALRASDLVRPETIRGTEPIRSALLATELEERRKEIQKLRTELAARREEVGRSHQTINQLADARVRLQARVEQLDTEVLDRGRELVAARVAADLRAGALAEELNARLALEERIRVADVLLATKDREITGYRERLDALRHAARPDRATP